MTTLTEEFINKILEQVGPYLTELNTVREFLKTRINRDVDEIIKELEKDYEELSSEAVRTDHRILITVLKGI